VTEFTSKRFLDKLGLMCGNEQNYSVSHGKAVGYILSLLGGEVALGRWSSDGFLLNAALEASLIITSNIAKLTKPQKAEIEFDYPSPTASSVIVMGGVCLETRLTDMESLDGESVVALLESGGAMLLALETFVS
jgi:hypothetical protein